MVHFVYLNPRRSEYAHRLSYILHHGEIPKGLHVMHSCDNTLCVNPAHLSAGTALDNAEDKRRKGRCPRTNAKLTIDQVRQIKVRLADGEHHHDIAQKYDVGRCAVTQINIGNNWKDIK